MIQARNLSFHRNGTAVLNSLSFDITPGEIVAVLGPNGAGKTTLLHLLSGSEKPSQGDILLNGTPLQNFASSELARLRSVVSQKVHLTLPYTVLDLVLLGRLPHNRGRETDHDRALARQALGDVHAGHLAGRRYTELSGGEQQRVHVARALAQIAHHHSSVSRVLLLDEPTAHLDPGQSYRLMDLLRSLRSTTLGMMIVLHDVNLAARYADRIILLSNGNQAGIGTPQEILTPASVSALYGVETTVLHTPDGIPLVVPLQVTARSSKNGALASAGVPAPGGGSHLPETGEYRPQADNR